MTSLKTAAKETTILDSIKWNNYPPSPQSNDEGAKEQEMRHFGIIEMGGGVVLMFLLFCPRLQVHVPPGGGVFPYMGYIGMCGPKGMVFRLFCSKIGYQFKSIIIRKFKL